MSTGNARDVPPKAVTRAGRGAPIPGSGQEFPGAWLIAAAAWNAIVLGVVLVTDLPPPGVEPLVAYVVVGTFAGAGLLLIYAFVRALRRYLRFRQVRLLLDPCPAVAGRELNGSITLPVPYRPADVYRVSVAARNYTVRRSGSKTFHGHHVLLELRASVRTAPAGVATRMQFRLALPAAAPATDDFGAEDFPVTGVAELSYIRWHVHLKADIPGADYHEDFEVPVVRPG